MQLNIKASAETVRRFVAISDAYEWPSGLTMEHAIGALERELAREGLPKAIIDRAWDAQVRLCRRFHRLTARGKPINITVVAIARELAAFIWDISRLAMSLAIPRSKLPAACV